MRMMIGVKVRELDNNSKLDVVGGGGVGGGGGGGAAPQGQEDS